MDGEVVLMHLFDIGAEADLSKVATLLAQPRTRTPLEPRQPMPATTNLPAPLEVNVDPALGASYLRFRRVWRAGGLLRSARSVLEQLSLLHLEHTRLKDNIYNAGKIFGDWYLAKAHTRLRDRFHLDEWERAVEAKMDRLENMFSLAHAEITARRSSVLEILVVLIIVFEFLRTFVFN